MRKDIDLNFVANPLTGDIPVKTGLDAIEQSLRNIILTDYYERGFNIYVGSDVNNTLFENDTQLIEQTLKDNITRACNNFEPNVDIVDVTVETDMPNELSVRIYYSAFNDPGIRILSVPLTRLR